LKRRGNFKSPSRIQKTTEGESAMSSRRNFVKTTAATAAALALPYNLLRAERPVEKAAAPLKILILGGTGFTGPHQVNYAVARGHTVTVFNRGQRQADIPTSVEQLRGDRNAVDGLASLKGSRTWDVIIDIPTTNPKWVRDAGEVLKGRAQQYIFISTISVYPHYQKAWADESYELAKYTGEKDPFTLTPQELGPLYGPMKVLSEQEAEKWFPGKTTVIRPGLIVGPGDTSDRFTYWPVRIARGGEVLAPGEGKEPVQIIDARDLAEWVIRMAESKTTGIYNATGPRSPLNFAELLGGVRAAMPGDLDIKFTWVPSAFLVEQRVQPWTGLGIWMPDRPNNEGWARANIEKAVAKGLTFRPLAVTAKDTLEWHHKVRPEAQRAMPRTLQAARETEVLAAWKAKASATG
jgi:2'-hydroxyisoflavone reductase